MMIRAKKLLGRVAFVSAALIVLVAIGQPTATSAEKAAARVVAATPASSAEKPPPISKGYRGRVIRVGKHKLTVRLKWKGRRTFQVAADATITRNATPVRLRRLRRRDEVRLTAEVGPRGEHLTIIHAWMPL